MRIYPRSRAWLALLALILALPSPAAEPAEISVPKKLLKKLKSFEPSAALYLADRDKYLIASDDTDEASTPMLFLMNDRGEVEKDPALFEGVGQLTDIESLSTDGNWIYALASQSRNKKGKVLPERNLLVRGKLAGERTFVAEAVELRPRLLAALAKASDPTLQKLKGQFATLLEAESSFVRRGKFYAGLKAPQPTTGRALVLELGNVDDLFGDGIPAVRVAFEVDLGKGNLLSDLIVTEHGFLLASTDGKGGGNLWLYDEKTGTVEPRRSYPAACPEGLATGKSAGEVLVVFDQGEGNALFSRERI